MLNVQEFSKLRAALLSNQQISILRHQNCLANFIALIYQEGQMFSVLQQNLIIESDGEEYVTIFLHRIYFFVHSLPMPSQNL